MQEEIYKLMLKYFFKANPKFDQNFIVDKRVIEKIIETLDLKKDDIVLEIGGGTGNLTKELIKKCKVIVVEKDPLMVEILKNELPQDNLEIINKDFLEIDLNKLNFTKIAGLIPYSISHNILEKINATKPAVIVVQKEFAEKLVAVNGFQNYVSSSVLAQSYGDIRLIKNIGKSSFYPKPNVKSTIIEIIPKIHKQDERYNKFVKTIFRYSNKNLQNALKYLETKKDYKIDNELFKVKVKQLSTDEIMKLYKQIYN